MARLHWLVEFIPAVVCKDIVSIQPLFTFVIGIIMKTSLLSFENGGTEICSNDKFPDFECVGHVVPLSEHLQKSQIL